MAHHAGIIDTLQLRVSFTHSDMIFLGYEMEERFGEFIEWISSNYPQYSMFKTMEWMGFDKYPGFTGGDWSYINESFEIVSIWGLGSDYIYFTIRPRNQTALIFAARHSSNEYEEISIEDALSKITIF